VNKPCDDSLRLADGLHSFILHQSKTNHYDHAMIPIRALAAPFAALVLGSCASQNAEPPHSAISSGNVNASAAATENPVYDTPAAYEEGGAVTPAPEAAIPSVAAAPNIPAATTPKAPSNGAAIIHTVVAGDTISGISAKYKVPVAAIKKANGMTKDIVILGKKMVIPPVH
jgi:LysM repeat protein